MAFRHIGSIAKCANSTNLNPNPNPNPKPKAKPKAKAKSERQAELLVSQIARKLVDGEQFETLEEFELFKAEFSAEVVSAVRELADGIQERLSPDGRLVVDHLLEHYASDGVLSHIWHDLPVQLERLSEEERAIAAIMLLIRI